MVWFRDVKDRERRKGTIIGSDGPNWCVKWNGHIRTVAPYDIWKMREERTLVEEEQDDPEPVGTQNKETETQKQPEQVTMEIDPPEHH